MMLALLEPGTAVKRDKLATTPGYVGAALAGMGVSVSHRIARGVLAGLSGRRAVFHVTRKGPVDRPRETRRGERLGTFASVREEIALLTGLLTCIVAIGLQAASSESAGAGWLQVELAMQALPYAAAIFCAWLSGAEQRG